MKITLPIILLIFVNFIYSQETFSEFDKSNNGFEIEKVKNSDLQLIKEIFRDNKGKILSYYNYDPKKGKLDGDFDNSFYSGNYKNGLINSENYLHFLNPSSSNNVLFIQGRIVAGKLDGYYDVFLRTYDTQSYNEQFSTKQNYIRGEFTKDYPFFSPYSSFANNPILIIDENGDKLYVYGTDKEWKKMKTVLEKEFGGLVEFKRDKNNMIYAVPSEKSMKNWGIYIAAVSLFDKSPKLKQLMTIIDDSKDTKIDLVLGEKTKQTVFGGFRGGTTTGNQTIDMADVLKLEESVVLSPFGDIMHELVEAYEDQVTNGKPEVKGKTNAEVTTDFIKKFTGPHAAALIAQAETMGYAEVKNEGPPADKNGNSEIYFIGIKKDPLGNVTQLDLTIVKMKDNNVVSIKNIVNVSSYTTDAKTGKAKYTGGTEVKK